MVNIDICDTGMEGIPHGSGWVLGVDIVEREEIVKVDNRDKRDYRRGAWL